MAAVMKHVAEGLTHRMGHKLVPHHAPIDVKELLVRLAPGEGRPEHPAVQPQVHRLLVQPQGLLPKARAEQPVQALAHAPGVVLRRRQVHEGAAVVA